MSEIEIARADAAAAWDKCEERRIQAEEALAALESLLAATTRVYGRGRPGRCEVLLEAVEEARLFVSKAKEER